MRHSFFTSCIWILLVISLCLTLCSCGGSAISGESQLPSAKQGTSDDDSGSSEKMDASQSGETGSRDNTPVVLVGVADGVSTIGNESVVIDISHTSEGYMMVDYTGSNPKVKCQLTGPDQVTYTYNLSEGYDTFPLTAGNGSYTIGIFEFIDGSSYSTLFTQSFEVSITNEFGPYLYANQYVNFTSDSACVEKGAALARSADNDVEVIQNVYNYIITNFTYDYAKAETVESGYLPDVDQICSVQTGICFDYAAVMATMLRTQNIPTRLEVGYMEDVYHAWISTYISGKGWVNGIIEFDGNDWNLLDPTFASTSSDPVQFTTEADKYITKYVY